MSRFETYEAVQATSAYDSETDRRLVRQLYGEPMRHLLGEVGDVAGRRVLEIGCGNGEISVTLALGGASVIGIDRDPAALDRARHLAARWKAGDRCRFLLMDAEHPALRPGWADLLVSRSVLQYVDHTVFRAEAARVLKPDGRIALLENMSSNPPVALFRLMRRLTTRTPRESAHPRTHKRYVSWREIRGLREQDPTLRCRTFYLARFLSLYFRVWHPRWRISPALDNGVTRMDRAALAAWPPARRWAWLVAMIGGRPDPVPERVVPR